MIPAEYQELAQQMNRHARALAHPIRLAVLLALRDQTRSPNQLSQEFAESLGTVSYHVRLLRELELIELVDTKPRRGAIEHFYTLNGAGQQTVALLDSLRKTEDEDEDEPNS